METNSATQVTASTLGILTGLAGLSTVSSRFSRATSRQKA